MFGDSLVPSKVIMREGGQERLQSGDSTHGLVLGEVFLLVLLCMGKRTKDA